MVYEAKIKLLIDIFKGIFNLNGCTDLIYMEVIICIFTPHR